MKKVRLLSRGTFARSCRHLLRLVGAASLSAVVLASPALANSPPTASFYYPAAGATFTAPAAFQVKANATDSDGSISKVEFYWNGQLKATVTSAPYILNVSNALMGQHVFAVRAYDNNGGATFGQDLYVSVVSSPNNQAPTVALTSPTAGVSFTAPATVNLTANASDSGGISRVDFYKNGTKISSDSTAPYAASISGLPAGTYTFYAKAYDNEGLGAASSSVTVNVATGGTNVAPTVSLTAPAVGASYTAPASVTISASAADTDGTVSRVEFYNGATLLGTSTAAPYSFNWANLAAGTYSLTARAFDNSGAQTASTARSITVNPAANVAPTVSLTAPAAGASFTAPASVTLSASAADSDGTVSRVEFYNGATLLGTSTAAPYSFTWANVVAGTYSLTARAFDNSGAQTASAARSITVNPAANVAPTVSLTAPAVGASYTAPASVIISATAADSDGTVSRVEFYNGVTLLGTSTAAPYSFTWANVAAGTYSLTARAFDNSGAQTASTARSITVNPAGNTAPTVSLTAPTAGASFTAPASVTLSATAADSDGTVSRVEFFNGATLLGTSTAAPYSFTWTNVAAGTYSLTARAFDNSGAQTSSSAASITVNPAANTAPTVGLTAPTAGASYTAPASVTLSATAADSDGSVTRVEFYNGATLLGTSTAAPYSFTWTNVAAGTYSLTARAFDNSGAQTSSAATSITVNPAANVAPTVSLTAPAAGASYTAPASVTITATAADSDGTVTRVEFYNGATLLGTSTAAPYSFTWASVAAGTYSLTARAFDNSGAQTSSAATSITVNPAANVAPTVSLTAPTAGASYTAPASVTITATAADSDGTVTRVEFFNGATLLGTSTAAPYSFTWANVAAGTFSLTARAFDNSGAQTTSAATSITVTAAPATPATTLYFIHSDHLNTPRVVTSQAGTEVWRWEQAEPFGLNAANDDADGNGTRFEFNLRFAGQYYDRESGLHYNRNRDFDPTTGRYFQADPTGLADGPSLYSYVSGSPLGYIDPLGLCKINRTMKTDSEGNYIRSSLDGAPNGSEMGARTISSNPKHHDMAVRGANDMVGPSHTGTRGLSANLEPMSKPGQVNATVDTANLPKGLSAVNDHGTHVSILPNTDMTFGQYQGLLNSVPWR